MVHVIESVVDALPIRLWKPLNMYVGGRLHFCHGAGRDEDLSVRTVEWNGRIVASGRAPFPYEWWDAEFDHLDDGDDQP
jgi:hypothetical protein